MLTRIPAASLTNDVAPIIEAQIIARTLDINAVATITPVLLQGTSPLWSSPNLPTWASINASTGVVTGTPTAETALTSFDIVARVASLSASDTKTFEFEVIDSSANGDVEIKLISSQASITHGDTVNFHFELVDGLNAPANAQGSSIQPRLFYEGSEIADSSEIVGDTTFGVPEIPIGAAESAVFSMTFSGPTEGAFKVQAGYVSGGSGHDSVSAHSTDASLVIPVSAPVVSNDIDLQLSVDDTSAIEGQTVNVKVQAVNRTTRAPYAVEGTDATFSVAYPLSEINSADVAGDVIAGSIPVGQSEVIIPLTFANPMAATLPASLQIDISNPAGGSGHDSAPQIDIAANSITIVASAAPTGGTSYMTIIGQDDLPVTQDAWPYTPDVSMWASAFPAYNPPVSVQEWGEGYFTDSQKFVMEAWRLHKSAKSWEWDDANYRVVMMWWEDETPETSNYKVL